MAGKLYGAKRRRLQLCWLEVVREARGRLTRSGASYVIGFEERIWFSLAGLALEEGAKNMEAGSQWPSPDHSEPIAAEVVWLPGLVAVEVMVWIPKLAVTEVVGQSSVVIYGLAIIRLHIQSLHSSFWSLDCERLSNSQKSRDSALPLLKIQSVVSRDFSWPFCYVIMAIISRAISCAEAFKVVDSMQWSSIMTTITKTRTVNNPCKIL